MFNTLKIKVFGMRQGDNINAIAALLPDYLGFIFYDKSPRYIGDDYAPSNMQRLPECIQRTGVFVNDTEERIAQMVERYALNAVQLHGHESVALCRKVSQMGVEVIKAFQVDVHFDFSILEGYDEACDYYLFDTKTKGYGGSGHKFDWNMLKQYNNRKPIFLSGGITCEDVESIQKMSYLNIYAVDINSKFETEPALKDVALVSAFVSKLRK